MELTTTELAGAAVASRYEIYSRIGQGATSRVYKAFDLDKNLVVALKCLRYPGEETDRYNLKHEFRSLCDIYHPNLAQLYDLEIGENYCFISMELVEGSDFLTFVRRSPSDQRTAFDDVRIALGHLVSGLTALHSAGKLHQDIKPTNVLVEPSGRAVLVDFGLSMDLRAADFQFVSQSLRHAGTPAYMAPERLRLGSPTEASDWYSVGAMLYEALVGVVPFRIDDCDNYYIALSEAQKTPPLAPHLLNSKVPRDLSELTLALLQWDPSVRPTGADVAKLASLKVATSSATQHSLLLERARELFVGREEEQECLLQAFTTSLRQHVTVLIEGISGVGKTTLIEQFVSSAFESEGALVLRSRCHPQETVQYNAVDGLIDNLSRFLFLRPSYLADLPTHNISALFKVFPVLARTPLRMSFDLPELATDPHVVLRQALEGLRKLLTNIAKERPLIACIDDAQWCDLASVPLVREVFKHAQAPANLLILSFRSEDRDSAIIKSLSELGESATPAPLEHITLSPLNEGEIRSLISKVEGVVPYEDPDLPRRVRDDTGGLPLFVMEWAYRYQTMSCQDRTRRIDVGSLLEDRITSLPEGLRSLLEIVAVSRVPLEQGVLMELAGSTGAGVDSLYRLCREHILRRTMLRGQWALESYHDRIRQIVLHPVSAENLQILHRRIAKALTGRPSSDPEILVEHYLGAGDRLEAARYAIVGGRHAAERLAFDRAAELFDLAVNLRDCREGDWNLLEEHAQALANAGRTNEAAQTYLKAATNAEKLNCEAVKISAIKVRAAEQFLTGGFLASGSSLLRGVFDDLKLAFPTGPASAHLISLRNRAKFLCKMWLRNRGGNLSQALRPSGATSPEVLLRLDTLWVASRSMVMLDYLVGEAMASWYLTEAARQSDPSRLLRALGLEASIYANVGRRWSWQRSASFLQQAEELLQESKNPYDPAFLELCRTSIAWCGGDWRTCVALARSTIAHLRSKCAGVNWDVAIVLGFAVSAQVFLGELRELAQATPELLSDAERRGDRYTATVFRSGYLVFLTLAEDRPEDALGAAELTIEGAPSDRFTSLHFHHFNAATNAFLYSGRVWDAWALLEQCWPLIKGAGLHHLGCIGTLLRETRARVALAAAREKPTKDFPGWTKSRLLSMALKEANAIAVRKFLPHADAMAAGIRAGAAAVEGNQSHEKDALLSAVSGFEIAHMNLYRAAAQLRLGVLLGGCEGDELVNTSRAFFESQGIKKPGAMAALLLPGASLQ